MTARIPFLIAATLFLSGLPINAQQAFHNLNFEKADPGSINISSGIPVTSALSDWTVTIGGVQQTDVGYNYPSAGAPAVSVIGNPGYGPTGYAPIDGNFSVLLQGSGVPYAASISQTGLIPTGTQSLFFEAEPGSGTLDVLIGNQVVPFVAISTAPTYTTYGANIASWAGLPEPLTFSALQASDLNNWLIDDISFSTATVTPEPGVVALATITGLIFGAPKWLSRR